MRGFDAGGEICQDTGMKIQLVLGLGLLVALTGLPAEEKKVAVKSAEERVTELEARVVKLEAEVRRLKEKPKVPVVTTVPKDSRVRQSKGQSAEDRNRDMILSEAGKTKLREKFVEHREGMMNMTAEERSEFMKNLFSEVLREDAGAVKKEVK
jgi:hypothetical protein